MLRIALVLTFVLAPAIALACGMESDVAVSLADLLDEVDAAETETATETATESATETETETATETETETADVRVATASGSFEEAAAAAARQE